MLDHKPRRKGVRKITDFFAKITKKPRPIAIELKGIRKSPSDSMDEKEDLEEVEEEPKKQESKKPKVFASMKPVKKTDKALDMYQIPEERIGANPDVEYRIAHMKYYDYLVGEKFPLLSKDFYAKANNMKGRTFRDWFPNREFYKFILRKVEGVIKKH